MQKRHGAIELLRNIPKGKVVTYKEMARVCNTSPRAIGRIMGSNTDPIGFPCYKVVASDGRLCGYSAAGGLHTKRVLLEKEGIEFTGDRVDKKYFHQFNRLT